VTPEERKAYVQRRKELWEACSPKARAAAMILKEADLLQIPCKKRGWGLSACLLIWTAQEIDKALERYLEER